MKDTLHKKMWEDVVIDEQTDHEEARNQMPVHTTSRREAILNVVEIANARIDHIAHINNLPPAEARAARLNPERILELVDVDE